MRHDRGPVLRPVFHRTTPMQTIRSDLALIADEHAVLSWQCRILIDAVDGGRPLGTLRRYLQGLLDAARNHFRSEERVMRLTGFAAAADHHADHERFLREAATAVRRIDASPTACDWAGVCADLQRQLSEHSARDDRMLEAHAQRLLV